MDAGRRFAPYGRCSSGRPRSHTQRVSERAPRPSGSLLRVPTSITRRIWPATWAGRGIAITVALMVLAMLVPAVFGWHVHALGNAPLSAGWRPRFGAGTLPAVAVGVATLRWAARLAGSLSWLRFLLASFVLGVAWLTSLATVDGWRGIGGVLGRSDEYLPTARQVTDISATLHEFVQRIPSTSVGNWPTHVAGHPPGALLFFVLLVRLGLGGGLAAGWVVLVLAATTPGAVLITLRQLGAEGAARCGAPFLVVGPAAIWLAVSADAMFGAVAAWGLCCLAAAATTRNAVRMVGLSVLAGLLLGYCCFLSYGLPLLAVLTLAVLFVARNPRPILGTAIGGSAVVAAFAVNGFVWWRAFPVLRERYYAGIASIRPAAYWVWGDLAALAFSAGPLVGASVAVAVARAREVRTGDVTTRPVITLTLAACTCIVLADLSFMSKSETDRIWLPFVPWLLLSAALLPERWRRRALAGQVVLAIALQTLLFSRW